MIHTSTYCLDSGTNLLNSVQTLPVMPVDLGMLLRVTTGPLRLVAVRVTMMTALIALSAVTVLSIFWRMWRI